MSSQTPPVETATVSHALDDPRIPRADLDRPLVSVIVTSYNYAPYLTECLRSIARQTYPRWECVVVDDRSQDDSPRIIEAFIASDEAGGRFRLIRHETNSGQMEGFKTGLRECKGVFVVQVDADDVLLEDFMEEHVRAHLGRKPVAFTSSNQYQIDASGQIVSGEHLDHQSKGFFRLVGPLGFQRGFWIWATCSSMMFRRETLRLVLEGQAKTFRICADYYIAHFCNLFGSSLLIPTVHGCYRRHGGNNFGSNPVLGAINSVGCMTRHPPHDDFRRAMLDHLLANQDRVFPILGPREQMFMFFRIATLPELMALSRERPGLFPLKGAKLALKYLWYRTRRRRFDKMPWSKRLNPVGKPY